MLLIFLATFFAVSVHGAGEKILINEIAWMGTPVQGVEEKQWWRYEWVELFNAKDNPLQLDGWSVELYRGEELYFEIPIVGTVPTMGYFLVGSSGKIPGIDVDYSNLGGKFLNTGMRVTLKNALGEVVDEVDATSGWPGGDNKTKQTMERVVGSDPTTVWQASAEPGGTPKAPNSEGYQSSPPRVGNTSDSKISSLGLAREESFYDSHGNVNEIGQGNEKDPVRSSSLSSPQLQQFESRVPIVNPITLLAGSLALGFSGALLLAKRLLASRQEPGQLEHPERSRRT